MASVKPKAVSGGWNEADTGALRHRGHDCGGDGTIRCQLDCRADYRGTGGAMRRPGQQRLVVIPITWREACEFVKAHHRHHKEPRGQKFAIGVIDEGGELRGVATCGRPVSKEIAKDPFILEVNRTCTAGFPNANSCLYGACYRIAMAMGYNKVITDIEDGESGVSLKAAGWVEGEKRKPRPNWANSSKKLRHLRDRGAREMVSRTRWYKKGTP